MANPKKKDLRSSPNVYVIAGPNGAGKTTFARQFLPAYADCRNFINADLIAQGVSPFAPERAAIKAGRLMLEQIREFAQQNVDFGFETTLSGMSYLTMLRSLQADGYAVHLFYLWVPTVQLAVSRVRARVLRGGHDIATEVVRRRFSRSIGNFFTQYQELADSWIFFDNSGATPKIIAAEKDGVLRIIQEELYRDLLSKYGESLA